MNHVTERDRDQARELGKAIFGDYLSEAGREFTLICQAMADAREPFTKPLVHELKPLMISGVSRLAIAPT